MTPHPLALSEPQLNIVLEYAKRVPAQWRSRFLEGAADQLLFDSNDCIETADVITAVHAILHRIGVEGGASR